MVHKQNTNQDRFFKELTLVGQKKPVSQNYLFIAYLFIVLLQYCVQKYLVCIKP